MDTLKLINERSQPVERTWVIKNVIIWSPFCALLVSTIGKKFIFSHFIAALIISPPLIYLYLTLTIKNYHYEFGEKLISLKQGIISKSERTAMYGRIQNVCISQEGIINRLIGLASISIETASEGAGAKFLAQDSQSKKNSAFSLLGFRSNRIGIPGLLYKNASELKNLVMDRIKSNPIDDAQSGL